MSKIAIVFPGQGSQFAGMGKALFDNFAVARDVFNEADEALSSDLKGKLSDIIFNNPDEKLLLTENTQPAILTTSIAILETLKSESGIKNISELANFVAGHSLGEYTALTAAGSIKLADAVRLVRLRGKSMQSAVPFGAGAMAALIGVTIEEAIEITTLASSKTQLCQIANDNSVGQIVISGANQAVENAVQLAIDRSKKAIKLAVSAPFHSHLMEPVKEIMAEALEKIDFLAPQIPLISNISSKAETEPKILKDLLVQQVSGSVRWRESVLELKNLGVEKILEVGPGKVLTGLTKRIDASITSISLQHIEDISNYLGVKVS